MKLNLNREDRLTLIKMLEKDLDCELRVTEFNKYGRNELWVWLDNNAEPRFGPGGPVVFIFNKNDNDRIEDSSSI